MSQDVTLVNTYYPISYFTDEGIVAIQSTQASRFWASEEKLPPAADSLTFDLGRVRPVNFFSLEISNKPIDLHFEYSTDNVTWQELPIDPNFTPQLQLVYFPNNASTWAQVENHFQLTQVRYVRVTFTRRTDPFPTSEDDLFLWSIEVRDARPMYVLSSSEDYLTDVGVDILGNSYRTDQDLFPATNATDGDETTYWQSQPNPSRFAVEAMYFDMRHDSIVGTMGYLEQFELGDIDSLSMADVEIYPPGGVVIDEIYIDPITLGPSMHIYYSLDDTADWDSKLWVPVNRHYILKKGFHALPDPTYVKFVKLEFTNLTPIPYNAPESNPLEVTYRKYPIWVQTYFASEKDTPETFIDPLDRVTIEPLKLGFTRDLDLLNSGLEIRQPAANDDTAKEIQDFMARLSSPQQPTETQEDIESQIEYFTPTMYQSDLNGQVNLDHAMGRLATQGESPWAIEERLPRDLPPTVQSVPDLSQAVDEKIMPIMWFPFTCRHAYQIVKAVRDAKVAYHVAIREVQLHRRDYTSDYDEPYYIETFASPDNIDTSTYVQDDWRYTAQP